MKDKKSKKQELENQLARALADYDNLRKRVDEEKKIWLSFASQRIIERLLPILDMFESALVHTQDQGLAIAIGEFKSVLKDEGLVEIKPSKGVEFDHDHMEAVDTVEVEEENMQGKVFETVSTGWKFNDGPVIRHAKVKVYQKGE